MKQRAFPGYGGIPHRHQRGPQATPLARPMNAVRRAARPRADQVAANDETGNRQMCSERARSNPSTCFSSTQCVAIFFDIRRIRSSKSVNRFYLNKTACTTTTQSDRTTLRSPFLQTNTRLLKSIQIAEKEKYRFKPTVHPHKNKNTFIKTDKLDILDANFRADFLNSNRTTFQTNPNQ
ncbi:hypothetical protein J6352_28360 [Burkholderia pseudomallei]|uniref:hypothetical protein n=1 Tax=Burkholderia pseudomallei TaxID=28450 RepID=UPI001AD62EF2|nr:hypothetical protein [Burkholderia pseudomallei]MBO7776396.1 hypothetical protein [Burkholderia pseudomallei]MBO7909278.1 hypothetical protein [Burkholderia pseudomallei]